MLINKYVMLFLVIACKEKISVQIGLKKSMNLNLTFESWALNNKYSLVGKGMVISRREKQYNCYLKH